MMRVSVKYFVDTTTGTQEVSSKYIHTPTFFYMYIYKSGEISGLLIFIKPIFFPWLLHIENFIFVQPSSLKLCLIRPVGRNFKLGWPHNCLFSCVFLSYIRQKLGRTSVVLPYFCQKLGSHMPPLQSLPMALCTTYVQPMYLHTNMIQNAIFILHEFVRRAMIIFSYQQICLRCEILMKNLCNTISNVILWQIS